MKTQQSYQEVIVEVNNELLLIKDKKIDLQAHFYGLKLKEPERFARLEFDTNGGSPFSKDLESIFFDLKIASE